MHRTSTTSHVYSQCASFHMPARVHAKSVREQCMPRTGESANAAHVFAVISKSLAPKYVARCPQPALVLLRNPSAHSPHPVTYPRFLPLAGQKHMLLVVWAFVFVHRMCARRVDSTSRPGWGCGGGNRSPRLCRIVPAVPCVSATLPLFHFTV